MRRKRTVKTRIIIVGSLTLITMAMWIGTEMYRRLTTDRQSPAVEQEIAILNPTLDLTVLDKVFERRAVQISLE